MKKVTKSPAAKKSTARWLKLVGAILLFIGVAAMGDAFSGALIYGWLQDLWWLDSGKKILYTIDRKWPLEGPEVVDFC